MKKRRVVAVEVLEMLKARDKSEKLAWDLRITSLYINVIKKEENALYINAVC